MRIPWIILLRSNVLLGNLVDLNYKSVLVCGGTGGWCGSSSTFNHTNHLWPPNHMTVVTLTRTLLLLVLSVFESHYINTLFCIDQTFVCDLRRWDVCTFLPPPHCDGVFRLHSNRQQQFSCSAEVDVADTFRMGTTKDGQRLFGHGIPHMYGWSKACGRDQNRRNQRTEEPHNQGIK